MNRILAIMVSVCKRKFTDIDLGEFTFLVKRSTLLAILQALQAKVSPQAFTRVSSQALTYLVKRSTLPATPQAL